MFKAIKGLLHRQQGIPVVTKQEIDTERLDQSMQLLTTTTMEVSEAAISAAKALQQKLQDVERRFMSIVDSVDDLVLIKDAEGRWKTLNRVGQESFGWLHGEYYDKTDKQLIEEYPHLKQCMELCQRTDDLAWDLGQSYRCEETLPHGNEIQYLDVIKTPIFHPDGSRKELIIIGRDMTELNNRQKRTSACFTALNTASDIIVILDRFGRVFFCNDRFVHEYDHDDYNAVVGRKVEDIVELDPSYDDMWSVARQNKNWEGHTKLNAAGRRYTVSVVPMMNGMPEPIFYVWTLKLWFDK